MVNVLICGDFYPNDRVNDLLNLKKYNEIFSDYKFIIEAADYSIVNLEAPIVEGNNIPTIKLGPSLKCQNNVLDVLKYAGFSMITLANNHFYDYGDVGVNDTINYCKRLNIDFVGGGVNIQEAQQIVYKNIKEKKIAFINICENEFSIANEIHGGSNPLNPINNYCQIKKARQNADYVVLITHGGHEYYPLPSPRMKATFRFFVDAGANVVVNHHQHCFSGYEIYNGIPIFYGLGNFSFDWEGKRNSVWNEGYGVLFSFEKDDIAFSLHPFIQGNVNPGIVLMNDEQKDEFNKKIKELNHIITNDELLEKAFTELVLSRGKEFLTVLEPYENKYIRYLFRKGLIPSLLSKKKKLRLLNTIRCESHRDVLLKVLSYENSYTLK